MELWSVALWLSIQLGLSLSAELQLPDTGSVGLRYEADFGDKFTIDCSARLNSPGLLNWTTQWYHNDSELWFQPDDSAQLLPNGSVRVTIRDWQDDGYYHCLVVDSFNEEKLRGHLTQIQIIRIDGWAREPVDFITNVGRVARFECRLSRAIPAPEYNWTFNSLPIPDDSRFIALSSGILHVINVSQVNVGVYRCVARNRKGSAVSSPATLSLQDTLVVKPKPENIHGQFYVVQQPGNQSIPLGGVANIECLAEKMVTAAGATGETVFVPASVQWKHLVNTKMELLDEHSDRIVVTQSTLTIRDFRESDEGGYVCSSAGGRLHGVLPLAIGTLIAEYPPRNHGQKEGFYEAPRSGLFSSGVTVRLACSVSTSPIPVLRWYRNGELIRNEGNIKLIPEEMFPPESLIVPKNGYRIYRRDLVISGMEPKFEGVYQCSASGEFGEITVAARVLFRRQEDSDADLLIPVEVKAQTVSDRLVRITWKNFELDQTAYEVKRLVLEYTPAGQTVNTEVVDSCSEAECSFDCCSSLHLQPFTNYTFRLRLVYYDKRSRKTRMGGYSDPVTSSTAEGYALVGAPLSVSGLSASNAVQLNWRELDRSDLQGTVHHYCLEYYDLETPTLVMRVNSLPPHIREYRVKSLSTGKTYNFRVIPATKMGLPKHLDDKSFPWVSFKVPETARLLPPTNLKVKPISNTSVNVSWALVRGVVSSDQMRVTCEEVGGSHNTSVDVTSSQGSHVISNLNPNTRYTVTLAYVASNGEVGLEASHTFPMPGLEMKPHPPGLLIEPPTAACDSATPYSILLKWDRSISSRNITSYQVRLSSPPLDTDDNINASSVQFFTVKDKFFNASSLLPGRSYYFAVRSIDHLSFTGFFSDDIECQTSDDAPSEPRNVSILAVNREDVHVSWLPPLNPNGRVLNYVIMFSNSMEGEILQHKSLGPHTYATISVPRAGVAYSFIVAAENQAGLGHSSTPVIWDGNVMYKTKSVTQAQVIVVASYKEGIIIGVGIALVFLCICVAILCCRDRLVHYIVTTANNSHISVQNGSPKKFVSNGCSPGETQFPVVELQTLISPATVSINEDHCDPADAEHSECCKAQHCGLMQRTPSSENEVDVAVIEQNNQVYSNLLSTKGLAPAPICKDNRSHGVLSLDMAIDNTSALSSSSPDSSLDSLADVLVVVNVESQSDSVPAGTDARRHRRRAASHPVCTDVALVESHQPKVAVSENFSDSGIGFEEVSHPRTTAMSFSESTGAVPNGHKPISAVATAVL